IDAEIQNGIGRFFAAKLRAGVLYALYAKTGDPEARAEALKQYRNARAAWQGTVDRAAGVYRNDLTFGYAPYLRGTWADRMAAIDQDIAAMEAASIPSKGAPAGGAIQAALGSTRRASTPVHHTPVRRVKPGEAVVIEAATPAP